MTHQSSGGWRVGSTGERRKKREWVTSFDCCRLQGGHICSCSAVNQATAILGSRWCGGIMVSAMKLGLFFCIVYRYKHEKGSVAVFCHFVSLKLRYWFNRISD